jgi:hypothetical protein
MCTALGKIGMGFSIDDMSVPSVDRNPPIPVYALIACTA